MAELTPLVQSEVELILPIENACHAYPSSLDLLNTCFSKRYRNAKLTANGEVVGFYLAELLIDEMTLHDICVAPEAQGNGYGRLLLDHFIDMAKTHKAVQLWLEVRKSNEAAIALYQSSGFDVVGTRQGYYPSPGGREDALLMGSAIIYD